jgi:hypothetical protein
MRRTVCRWIFAICVLGLTQPALALVYVPGQHREDGIYIRPHFRSPDARLDESWFKDLADPLAGKKDGKLPPAEPTSSKGKDLPASAR